MTRTLNCTQKLISFAIEAATAEKVSGGQTNRAHNYPSVLHYGPA